MFTKHFWTQTCNGFLLLFFKFSIEYSVPTLRRKKRIKSKDKNRMTFSTNKHPWNLNEYAQREIAVYVSVYLCLSIWDINNVSLFFFSPFFINYFCQDNTAKFLLYVMAKSKVWINVIKEHLSFGVRLCKKISDS